MNKMKFILPILVISLFFNSCYYNCKCNDSYIKLPEETKEWFWFKEGSWWVYRNVEDTSILDTLQLIYSTDESSNKFCRSSFASALGCSEILTVELIHSNVKYFQSYSDSNIAGGESYFVYSPHGGGQYLYNTSFNKGHSTTGPFLGFPIIIGENYDGYILNDTNNITINNILYTNVAHSISQSSSYNGIKEIWWAKGIGLLKIIKASGIHPEMTWELIESHTN